MLKLSRSLLLYGLLASLAISIIAGMAAGFGALGTAYFASTEQPLGNSSTGPVSWHLSRWSQSPVTPRNQLPEWVMNKPNASGDDRPQGRVSGNSPGAVNREAAPCHSCPSPVPPKSTGCHGNP